MEPKITVDQLFAKVQQFQAACIRAGGEHKWEDFTKLRKEFRKWAEENELNISFPSDEEI